jgi:hypothetical protein
LTLSVTYLVTEKYDPTRNEIGLKVSTRGFSEFKGAKIRLSGFPPQEKTFSRTGALTFEAMGKPGNNTLEVIDSKTSMVLQQISSINTNLLKKGPKGQEITITHKSRKAEIEIKKVPILKNEYLRIDASPKISLFFGINEETDQPNYTTKLDKKGSITTEISGPMSDKHEIKVLTGQMNQICSIKPPENQ